jgi:hypothetical protein
MSLFPIVVFNFVISPHHHTTSQLMGVIQRRWQSDTMEHCNSQMKKVSPFNFTYQNFSLTWEWRLAPQSACIHDKLPWAVLVSGVYAYCFLWNLSCNKYAYVNQQFMFLLELNVLPFTAFSLPLFKVQILNFKFIFSIWLPNYAACWWHRIQMLFLWSVCVRSVFGFEFNAVGWSQGYWRC